MTDVNMNTTTTQGDGATTDASKPILNKKSDHAIHQPGRKRRASGMTRLLGYTMLRKGNPQPLVIVTVMTLRTNPGIDYLRRTLFERIIELPRFRSVVVTNKGKLHFEEAKNLDIGYHFEVYGFGRKVSKTELEDLVATSKARPLSIEHPLWRVIHIPEMEDGTCKVIYVINHLIGDGVSLVNALLFKLIDESEELSQKADAAAVSRRKSKPNLPLGERIRLGVWGFYEGQTGPFWSQDRKNPLKLIGHPSAEKAVASSPKLELDRVKEVCRAIGQGVTINDVLLATFTKTMAYYFRDIANESPEAIKTRKVRINFPVNVRKSQPKASEFSDTSNQFGLALFALPLTDFEGTDTLVLEIKRRVDRIKCSPAVPIAAGAPGRILPVMPVTAAVDVGFNAANIATCMLSNVPGPQQQCHLAGAPLDDMEFYLFSQVGSYFGIFSYNGMVSATANIDKKVGADPHKLVDLFVPAFMEIYDDICGKKAQQQAQEATAASAPLPQQ